MDAGKGTVREAGSKKEKRGKEQGRERDSGGKTNEGM